MFPENAFELGYPVIILGRTNRTEVFKGEVSCREIKNGEVNYLLKPRLGESQWFTHDEVKNGFEEDEIKEDKDQGEL